jgi:hypothetical protein
MTTKPKTRKAPTKRTAIDPVFGAIAEHKAMDKEWSRLIDLLIEAENEARQKHGKRPGDQVKWGDHDYSGVGGLGDYREWLLSRPDADPKQIENEYLEAKARLASLQYEGIAWDIRAGTAQLREQRDRARRACENAEVKLGRTKPTTPAGAGALVAYILKNSDGEISLFGERALKTVASSLARMPA